MSRDTAVVLLLPLLMGFSGCGASSSAGFVPAIRSDSAWNDPVQVEPVDLGVIQVGESRTYVGRLRNGPRRVTIDRIETTCDCLEIQFERMALEADEEQLYRVTLIEDDEFTGSLNMHWTAYADDEPVFEGAVSVEIVPIDSLAVIGVE